jgi:hypothetical protein
MRHDPNSVPARLRPQALKQAERGRPLALPHWWMAVAQDCLARPPAFPAVVHRPALRPKAMAAFSDLDPLDNHSLDSVSSVFSCCIFVDRGPG